MPTAFLAGEAELIRACLLYRSDHGSVIGLPVQVASVAACVDEAHVAENRRLMENAVCAARSMSNAWTQMPAPKPVSSTWFGVIDAFPAYPA